MLRRPLFPGRNSIARSWNTLYTINGRLLCNQQRFCKYICALSFQRKKNLFQMFPDANPLARWRIFFDLNKFYFCFDASSSSTTPQDQDRHPEWRQSQWTRRPATSSSSKQPPNPNQDDSKQIVKIGTGKHGYYVYEEIVRNLRMMTMIMRLSPDIMIIIPRDQVKSARYGWRPWVSRDLRDTFFFGM